MLQSVFTGASALKTFSKGMEVIGNNVANVNSLGFKGQRAEYTDSFYNTFLKADNSETSGAPGHQIGSGVKLGNISGKFTQGSIQQTGVDTDLAIYGQGFFQVRDPEAADDADATLFTRAGNFNWDSQGRFVTNDGFIVQGDKGDLQIEDLTKVESFRFENDGTLRMLMEDGTEQLQQVFLTNFNVPGKLIREGGGYFSNKGDLGAQIDDGLVPPTTAGTGEIKPYSLELSNVDLTGEFSSIIANQRSFQAGARIVTVSDAMYGEAVNLKR
jgi:flagellar hook protein FlgE